MKMGKTVTMANEVRRCIVGTLGTISPRRHAISCTFKYDFATKGYDLYRQKVRELARVARTDTQPAERSFGFYGDQGSGDQRQIPPVLYTHYVVDSSNTLLTDTCYKWGSRQVRI